MIDKENISKKLNEQTSSVGFIYRHIGETMLLFGYFFGMPSEIQNTTMGQQDEGQGKDFDESKELIEKGYKMLEDIIESTSNSGWSEIIDTPFFGAVSKAKLFAHILFHKLLSFRPNWTSNQERFKIIFQPFNFLIVIYSIIAL